MAAEKANISTPPEPIRKPEKIKLPPREVFILFAFFIFVFLALYLPYLWRWYYVDLPLSSSLVSVETPTPVPSPIPSKTPEKTAVPSPAPTPVPAPTPLPAANPPSPSPLPQFASGPDATPPAEPTPTLTPLPPPPFGTGGGAVPVPPPAPPSENFRSESTPAPTPAFKEPSPSPAPTPAPTPYMFSGGGGGGIPFTADLANLIPYNGGYLWVARAPEPPPAPPPPPPTNFQPTAATLLYCKFDQNLTDDSSYHHLLKTNYNDHNGQFYFPGFTDTGAMANDGLIVNSRRIPRFVPVIYADFPENDLLDNEFTFSVWIMHNFWPNDPKGGPLIWIPGKLNITLLPEALGEGYNHSYRLTLTAVDASERVFNVSSPVINPQWELMTFTYKQGEFLRVYSDGQMFFEETNPGLLPALADGVPYFQINISEDVNGGACQPWIMGLGYDCGLISTLDEFVLDSVAWTAAQVGDYYALFQP